MKAQHVKLILFIMIAILWNESYAFTLIIKSNAKLKNLKIGEHQSVEPIDLKLGINNIRLEKYPNAVYLLQHKSASNFKYLSMIWVSSDTSSIEVMIDTDYTITFPHENEYQAELNKIFNASNKWSLFPYEPDDNQPLEPILVLEAKAMIQNLKTYTKRSVLENLLELSKQRTINNWSTDIISAYLREPPDKIYATGHLKQIFGLDSLGNLTEITLRNQKYILIAISGSWCGPCIKGIPNLRKLYDDLDENILFISLWNDPDLRTFRDNHRSKKQLISWPSLWDQSGLMANALQVNSYPTYILFDPQGVEIRRWEGKSPNNLENSISD